MKPRTLFAVLMLATLLALSLFGSAQAALSMKAYVPDKYDTVDFYGAVGDINPEDGDGFTTFAHMGMIVPLDGADIRMLTGFSLLSKKAVEEGGDNVDGWVTYSFSASPAEDTRDNTYPYYGGAKDGYFLHITNYSGTTAPNTVEVQFVRLQNGEPTYPVENFFLDNAIGVKMELSLAEQEDGTYTLTFTNATDQQVLKATEGVQMDRALFVNEKGQTFFSTAIYEGPGCDGNHWEHRYVKVFSVNALTPDIQTEDVTLEQESYDFVEGQLVMPAVSVKVDGQTLTADVDYVVTYSGNDAAGTAKAIVTFVGPYAGNVVEKEFVIK